MPVIGLFTINLPQNCCFFRCCVHCADLNACSFSKRHLILNRPKILGPCRGAYNTSSAEALSRTNETIWRTMGLRILLLEIKRMVRTGGLFQRTNKHSRHAKYEQISSTRHSAETVPDLLLHSLSKYAMEAMSPYGTSQWEKMRRVK